MATNNAINLKLSGVTTYDGAGTFTASTLTNHAVLLGAASNLINSLSLSDGQLAIGSTGADPVAAFLTPGIGINIANASGSITISSSGGGLSWTDVTGTTQAMLGNNGYTANNAGLVTLTLPGSIAYGTVLAVIGKGVGGWKIAQNSGQTIHFGSSNTTSGASGFLASTNQYDAVFLLCTVNNTDLTVYSSVGNITVN